MSRSVLAPPRTACWVTWLGAVYPGWWEGYYPAGDRYCQGPTDAWDHVSAPDRHSRTLQVPPHTGLPALKMPRSTTCIDQPHASINHMPRSTSCSGLHKPCSGLHKPCSGLHKPVSDLHKTVTLGHSRGDIRPFDQEYPKYGIFGRSGNVYPIPHGPIWG